MSELFTKIEIVQALVDTKDGVRKIINNDLTADLTLQVTLNEIAIKLGIMKEKESFEKLCSRYGVKRG